MKPGKKEKIRFGKAPQETLPSTPTGQTEDAGAGTPQVAANTGAEPDNPLENNAKPQKKSRFADRARLTKQPKAKGPQLDPEAPAPPDAGEVADRQAQQGALGLGGNQTPSKKKKKNTTTGEKTRLSDQKKKQEPEDTGERPLGNSPSQPQPGSQQSPATTPAPPQPGTPATPQQQQ